MNAQAVVDILMIVVSAATPLLIAAVGEIVGDFDGEFHPPSPYPIPGTRSTRAKTARALAGGYGFGGGFAHADAIGNADALIGVAGQVRAGDGLCARSSAE